MNSLKFKRVFITGGAGYVGSLLVPSLLSKGYEVIVYDLFLYGDTLPDNPRLKKIKGDIRDRDKLIKSAHGADAFIHLACISNDPSFDLAPDLGKSINFGAFPNVLDAARLGGVKRFILASSTSQYGIKPAHVKVTEETEAEPITDYARYKIECEKIMKTRADLVGNMEYVFVRPSTLCGYAPRLRLDVSVNTLTINALEKHKMRIKGGNQLRPTMNIKDMVRFYELMLEAPSELIDEQAFNVSYTNASILQFAQMVRDVLEDQTVEFEMIPSDDPRSYHVDATKIKKVLGFEFKYNVKDAINSIVEAYEEGKIKDGLNNPLYYNVKLMKETSLK